MNKKIVVLAITVLALAMFTAPVMAKTTLKDTKGNKVGVTVTLTRNSASDGGGPGILLEPNVVTGPNTHGHWEQHFFTTITFADGSTHEGTLVIERKVVIVARGPKIANKLIFTDYWVFTSNDRIAGFEGNSKVILDIEKGLSLAQGMFQGTGDFEGQTLNIGHTWAPYASAVNPWFGYWLNCPVYP